MNLSGLIRRAYRHSFTDRPKTQKPDPKLPLKTLCSMRFQLALDRVADMSRDVLEVRNALLAFGNPFSIIYNPKVSLSRLLSPKNMNLSRLRIDTIFDKLRDRFQRIGLAERQDRDRVPMIPDTKLP